jgi:hypothetical protein
MYKRTYHRTVTGHSCVTAFDEFSSVFRYIYTVVSHNNGVVVIPACIRNGLREAATIKEGTVLVANETKLT